MACQRPCQSEQASRVLESWISETRPQPWIAQDLTVDELLRRRYLDEPCRRSPPISKPGAEPSGAQVLVLMMQQLPRQIWRDSAMAFTGDVLMT